VKRWRKRWAGVRGAPHADAEKNTEGRSDHFLSGFKLNQFRSFKRATEIDMVSSLSNQDATAHYQQEVPGLHSGQEGTYEGAS